MKRFKKCLCLLAVLAALCMLLPTTAAAATIDSGKCGDNLTWKLTDNGTLTISGTGPMWDYYYDEPDEGISFMFEPTPWDRYYYGYIQKVVIKSGVTDIGDYAFYWISDLATVSIPNTVTSIGTKAFSRCYSLNGVKIPGSVKRIGEKAFEDCKSLTDITLSEGVEELDDRAFDGCNYLKHIDLPESLTRIGKGAFAECAQLESIVIPRGVTEIEEDTFRRCYALTRAVILDGVTQIDPFAFIACFDVTIHGYAGSAAEDFARNEDIRFEAIEPLKVTGISSNAVVANGGKASVTVNTTGSNLTYAWYCKNPGAAKFSKSTSFTGKKYTMTMDEQKSGRKVYCVITDEYGCSIQTETITLRLEQYAAITTEPADVSVPNGQKAKFTVKASGDGLTYQWYYKDANASRFSASTSGSSNTYTVAMKDGRDGRKVYCVITDQYGNSVKTRTATMRIDKTARIITQPQNVTVAPDNTAKVTVKASGDGLTYTWYYKNPGAKKFTRSTSSTGSSISVKMNESRDGRQVYCVIKDQYGNSVTTRTVTMTMEHYAQIVTQPQNVGVANGKSAKVTVKASGDGLTYAWYYKNPGASKFTKSSSVTGNSYSLTMNSNRSGRQIYCVITDRYGNSVRTNTVSMILKTVANFVEQPYPVVVDTKAQICVEAEGDGLTYQWYYKDADAKKFSKLTSVTGDSYSVSITKARNGRQVYCKITDKYGNSVKSNTVTMMTRDYFNKLSHDGKKALAKKVAQYIADSIGTKGTDLERVTKASQIVYAYCRECIYTTEGKDYREAHGVFIKGEYSCAGSTRALGMVLDCMGIKWTHENPNQWTHQWCTVKIDGKTGWADGMIGMAGYGAYPYPYY